MKYFILLITGLLLPLSAQGETLSPCHTSCFKAKQTCNARKMHTFNTCDQDLFTCRASCASGKAQESYSTKPPISIAFQSAIGLNR